MPRGREVRELEELGLGLAGGKNGSGQALLATRPREEEKASRPNTKEGKFFSRPFQIISKTIEIILNFGQNHSSQKLQCSSMYAQACN